MTDKTPLQLVNEMIASAEAYLAELAAALAELETQPLREDYVIVNASGFTLAFTLTPSESYPGVMIASAPHVCKSHKATKFSRGSAHTLAMNVFDGNNERAHALLYAEAVSMDHEREKRHIAQLVEARDRILAEGE